jgi:hypothetical protein
VFGATPWLGAALAHSTESQAQYDDFCDDSPGCDTDAITDTRSLSVPAERILQRFKECVLEVWRPLFAFHSREAAVKRFSGCGGNLKLSDAEYEVLKDMVLSHERHKAAEATEGGGVV